MQREYKAFETAKRKLNCKIENSIETMKVSIQVNRSEVRYTLLKVKSIKFDYTKQKEYAKRLKCPDVWTFLFMGTKIGNMEHL